MLDFDLDAAVRHNAKVLGLAPLADNTEARIAIALAHWQDTHGLEPDGAYDRATEESLNTARHALELDDGDVAEEVEPAGPKREWPKFAWPFRAGVKADDALGIPGPKGSAWHRANIIDLRGLDERKTKAGEPGYTAIHRAVAPAVVEAIRRVKLVAPGYRIKTVGGYVYRKIRHSKSDKAPWSKHARGGAFDLNSNENFGKTFGIDEDGPEPWTPEWNAIWKTGMPREVVEAIESVGFRWGGRWRAPKGRHGYRDPMHFEVPRVF